MLRGHFRDFSAERLMRFLTALGPRGRYVVRSPGEPAARADAIHLQFGETLSNACAAVPARC